MWFLSGREDVPIVKDTKQDMTTSRLYIACYTEVFLDNLEMENIQNCSFGVET